MKLEERAQMCVDNIGILGAYQGYIIGANEQKAIDDKECESLVGLAVKEARQVFIDKACEWITVKGVFCRVTCGDLKRYVENFRKAMESEGDRIEIPFVQVPESETAKLETSDITNLTWQDMARIADIMGHTRRLTEEGFTRNPEEFYTEVLEKFKEE